MGNTELPVDEVGDVEMRTSVGNTCFLMGKHRPRSPTLQTKPWEPENVMSIHPYLDILCSSRLKGLWCLFLFLFSFIPSFRVSMKFRGCNSGFWFGPPPPVLGCVEAILFRAYRSRLRSVSSCGNLQNHSLGMSRNLTTLQGFHIHSILTYCKIIKKCCKFSRTLLLLRNSR